MSESQATTDAPLFRVVAGQPSDDEVAALAVVLASRHGADARPHAPTSAALVGGWNSRWHLVRHPPLQGRDAWRSSARR